LLVDAMDRSSGKRAFLGGFLTGLACWTHPNALVFTLAIFIALTIMAGWKRTLGWWLIPVALGLFTGLLPYLAFVAYIQNTTEIRLAEQVAERSDILTRTIGSILTNEVKRWTNFIRLPERTPLLALYAWAAIWTAWRGTRKDRFLLILVLAMAIILPILVRVSHGRYLVVLVPALSAMIWRSLLKTWGPHTASSTSPASSKSFLSRLARRKGASIILVIYTLMSLAPTSAILWAYRNADYDRWVARVATTIPPDARVMGDTMFWIGLRNHPFISSIPPYYSDWRSVDDAVAHICKYRPDYLIQASSLYPGLDGLAPRSKNLRATRFGQACETMATRVPCQILTEFYDRDFGAVRVWKVNWPFPSTTSTNSGG
jgi:hypothetical protein